MKTELLIGALNLSSGSSVGAEWIETSIEDYVVEGAHMGECGYKCWIITSQSILGEYRRS